LKSTLGIISFYLFLLVCATYLPSAPSRIWRWPCGCGCPCSPRTGRRRPGRGSPCWPWPRTREQWRRPTSHRFARHCCTSANKKLGMHELRNFTTSTPLFLIYSLARDWDEIVAEALGSANKLMEKQRRQRGWSLRAHSLGLYGLYARGRTDGRVCCLWPLSQKFAPCVDSQWWKASLVRRPTQIEIKRVSCHNRICLRRARAWFVYYVYFLNWQRRNCFALAREPACVCLSVDGKWVGREEFMHMFSGSAAAVHFYAFDLHIVVFQYVVLRATLWYVLVFSWNRVGNWKRNLCKQHVKTALLLFVFISYHAFFVSKLTLWKYSGYSLVSNVYLISLFFSKKKST
jgi:hypothetical protein